MLCFAAWRRSAERCASPFKVAAPMLDNLSLVDECHWSNLRRPAPGRNRSVDPAEELVHRRAGRGGGLRVPDGCPAGGLVEAEFVRSASSGGEAAIQRGDDPLVRFVTEHAELRRDVDRAAG